jgi:uncharacterized cupin superfamily protein
VTQKVVLAMKAAEAPPRTKPSLYPQPFASRMSGRVKRPLGDVFGLKNFGVNLTRLAPDAVSALLHQHSRQDEFVFVLDGELTLVTDQGETLLTAGMCAGFPAKGLAHQLVNRSSRDALYLEIGDRSKGDRIFYPVDDLQAQMTCGGNWRFTHKDGTPYE